MHLVGLYTYDKDECTEICRLWRIFRKSKGFLFFGVGRQDEHKADYEVPSVEAYREATD